MTRVSSSRPRCFKSLTNVVMARSASLHFLGRPPGADDVVVSADAVMVPGAVIKLHEAGAAFDQAAGEKTIVGEGNFARFGAVHFVDGGRLLEISINVQERWFAF